MTRRLLHAGYAQVLRHVVDGGCTWLQLAEKMGLVRTSAQRTLAHLRDQQLIHIGAWEDRQCGMRIERTPLFVFGAGEDAPWPGKGAQRPRRPQPTPVELLTFCSAVKAMMYGPVMGNSLADETGMAPRTALGLIKRLRELNLAFIEDYQQRTCGLGYPMWRFGIDQPDKPKKKRMSARALWTKNNAIRAQRNAQARLLRILATGSPRRAANDGEREAA